MSMRLLLVNFHNHNVYSAMYNLVALASYVENIAEVRVIDGIREPVYDIIREWRPDFIGLTSYTIWYGQVVGYAHKIKDLFPWTKVIIGGPHITGLPRSFKNPPFDYGIIGEGENALSSLCRYSGSGGIQEKGIITDSFNGNRDNTDHTDPINIENLPIVRLDKYLPIDFYKDGMAGLVASRGCPFNCKYCSIRTMSKGVRLYPTEKVVDQIELCYNKLGSRTIIFWDDTFSINLNWLQSLIEELDRRKLLGKIQYHVHMRASIVTEERCELMKKMGVTVWNMGLDFGSDKVIKDVKGNDSSVEKNKEALLMAHKYGIATGGAVMFGAPNETFDDMKETLTFMSWYADMIQKGLCSGSIWFFVATPLPGTEWWKIAEKKGKVSWNMDCTRLSLHNWKEHFLLDDSVSEEQFNWIHEGAKKMMIRINGAWSEP